MSILRGQSLVDLCFSFSIDGTEDYFPSTPPSGSLSLDQQRVCYGVLARDDDILEGDQSYVVNLNSINTNVDPDQANLTFTIIDTDGVLAKQSVELLIYQSVNQIVELV